MDMNGYKTGVIGKNLTHSYSPMLHNLLGDMNYEIYDLAEKDLKQVQQEVEQQEKAEEEQNIDELKAKLKSLMTTTESKNKVKEFMKANSVKAVKDLSAEQLKELITLL